MQRSAGRAFQAEGRPAAELKDNEALGAGLKCMRGSGERQGGQGAFMESLAGHWQDFWKPLEGLKQSDTI